MATFFNPSEDEINFESFMKPSLFLFRLVWFDFEPRKVAATRKEMLKYYAKIAFFILCVVTIISAVILMSTHSIVNWDNFVDASSGVSNALAVALIALKALITFYHKKDFRKIFHEMSDLFADHAIDNKKYKIEKYFAEFNGLMIVYAIPCIFGTFLIFLTIFPYLYNGTMMRPTVEFWYPFDAFRLKTYPLAWTWSVWSYWITVIFLIASDSLLYGFITVIIMEFDILKSNFTDVMLVPKGERMKKFGSLINRHNKLLNLCDKLEDIYSVTFMLVVFVSSMILCFFIFKISTVSDITAPAYCFLISCAVLVEGQVWLLCFYGQKLIDSSESLTDGIYICDWESSGDIKFMKQFILIMIKAQKTTRFTAMGFVDISLVTFEKVCLDKFSIH